MLVSGGCQLPYVDDEKESPAPLAAFPPPPPPAAPARVPDTCGLVSREGGSLPPGRPACDEPQMLLAPRAA